LNDNFLAGLQHFGNELRAAVLFVPRVPVLRRLIGTPGTAASALGAPSPAHGTLEAGARLLGNARAGGRLYLARKRGSRGLVQFFVSLGVFLFGSFSVLLAESFAVFFRVAFRVFLFGSLPWRSLGGQRFVMHFVGEGVGFLRGVLVIGIQRFLQLFEFGGLYKGFGHRFNRLRPLFGIGLRFFVLGLGKLFGQRGYIFLREAGAIRSMRIRYLRWARFEIKPVEVASDVFLSVRRRGSILRSAGP
jgi:hypothetical protein